MLFACHSEGVSLSDHFLDDRIGTGGKAEADRKEHRKGCLGACGPNPTNTLSEFDTPLRIMS